MKDALGGHIDVHHFGQDEADEGQKDPLRDLAHPVILGGGAAHEGGGIDGVAPPGDGGDVKDGVGLRQGIVPGMVAEGALEAFLAGDDVALQDDFGVGRHQQIHRMGRGQFHAGVADEAGQGHFVHIGRQRRRARPDGGRVAAQGDGYLQAVGGAVAGGAVVARAYLVGLPVHPGGIAVKDLHPVDAVVLDAGCRVFGDYQRQGDVAAGVVGPAFDDGEGVQVDVVPGDDHFLAGGVADGFGLVGADAGQTPQGTQLVDDSRRRAAQGQVNQRFQAGGQLVGAIHFQGPVHAPVGAEQVDGYGQIVADHIFKEQGRPAGAQHPVGDFRNLQLRADGSGDAAQVAPAFQKGEVFAQVLVWHR